jgi:hypothetical protein
MKKRVKISEIVEKSKNLETTEEMSADAVPLLLCCFCGFSELLPS